MLGNKFSYVMYNYFLKFLSSYTIPISGKICNFVKNFVCKGFVEFRGNQVNIGKSVDISFGVSVGNNVGFGDYSKIGKDTFFGSDIMMGPDCYIYSVNHKKDRTDIPMTKQGNDDVKPVVIEDDVWIGARVIIIPGVKIGRGSVIGAGSIVTKDVPEYCIVAGNPARIVRRRK